MKLPIAVYISGEGTNLKAILDNCINVEVVSVVSDTMDLPILSKLPEHITVFPFLETENFGTGSLLRQHPHMIVLAGFMRILSKDFIDNANNSGTPILNIHPSLLPDHKGLNTHQKSYDADDEYHGCTVHLVTPELDSGPILAQRRFYAKFLSAAEREKECKHMEHFLYPTVIDTCAGLLMENTKL